MSRDYLLGLTDWSSHAPMKRARSALVRRQQASVDDEDTKCTVRDSQGNASFYRAKKWYL